ncbi:MAG: hypothetical protein ABI341_04610 [Nitrososphaera sp.]
MQNQHATNHDEFVIRVSKLVREHLTRVLGNSTVMVIDSWLRQRGCRGIEDICIDPEKVKLYLHMIFRDAAILLENEVARALEEEFLSYPEDNDHVKEVMLIVKKLRTHNR